MVGLNYAKQLRGCRFCHDCMQNIYFKSNPPFITFGAEVMNDLMNLADENK
jgi:hypothetical protein